MSSLAWERVTLATSDTASLRERTLGGTTALMHFIHFGFWYFFSVLSDDGWFVAVASVAVSTSMTSGLDCWNSGKYWLW